jgi:hypothetical protein
MTLHIDTAVAQIAGDAHAVLGQHPELHALQDQNLAGLRDHLADDGIDLADPAQARALFAGLALMNRVIPIPCPSLRAAAAGGLLATFACHITEGSTTG